MVGPLLYAKNLPAELPGYSLVCYSVVILVEDFFSPNDIVSERSIYSYMHGEPWLIKLSE